MEMPHAPSGQYGHQGQFTTGAPPPGQPVYNLYRPTYGSGPGPGPGLGPGQPPNGAPVAQGSTRNFVGGPTPPPSTANGVAPPSVQGPHPPFPMGGRPPMMPPHMMNRLPLPGQGQVWNLQESHLSEPLQPTSRHRSSPSNSSAQQPFYGFDKEAGVPSTSKAASDDKGDDTEDEAPSKPQHQIGQALTTNNKTGPQQLPLGALSRTSTSQSDAPTGEDGRGRRQSGLMAGIRGKLGGGGAANASDENRRDSWGAPNPQQSVTGDGVSEASIVMDESGQPKQRLPLSRLRNAENASDNAALYNPQAMGPQGIMGPQGPGNPPVGGNMNYPQQQQQPSFPPPEKKRSFFGNANSGNNAAPGMLRKGESDISRLSVSSTNPAEQGHGNGASKRGFSGFFGKLRQGGGNAHQESAGPAQPTSYRPLPSGFPPGNSMPPTQMQPPPGPGQPPADLTAPPPITGQGHSRRDSLSSTRSVTFAPIQNSQSSLAQQGAAGDGDKGKKLGSLFGFGKKKTEARPQPGPHQANQAMVGQGPPGAGVPGQAYPGPQFLAPQAPGQQPMVQMGRGQAGQAGQLPPAQMGRGLALPPEQGSPGQMGRGQATPEPGAQDQPGRPSSTGRGYTLTDRPVSTGPGEGPTDATRPPSTGRGGLAPGQIGQMGQAGPGAGPQQLGRGQGPPGFAAFPGQFGMQALGPDGRPILLQGQFNPQTGQFMVLLPPGVSPPPNAMVPAMNMRPVMPGQSSSQLNPMPSLPEDGPQSPQAAVDSPATGPTGQQTPQTNGLNTTTPLPSRSISTVEQESLRPDAPTPPGSRAQQQPGSPSSQRSQPVSVSTQDQSRGSLNTTPVQYRQPFQPPQSANASAPQAQGLAPTLTAGQIPARKPVHPVQSPPTSPAEAVKPQDTVNDTASRDQRSPSISSQARTSVPGAQGTASNPNHVDQAGRASGSPSTHRLSAQQPTQQQQSPLLSSPANQAPPNSSPHPSLQGSQQPQQPGQPPMGQPGAPFFGPGAPPGPAQNGPYPGFPPSGLRPPGASMAAPMAVPKEKEQSTLSKLLKGAKNPSHDKPEKKSIFSFRREHKQPSPPQPQSQTGPGQQGQQGQPFPPGPQFLRPQMTGPGQGPPPQSMPPQQVLRPQVTGPQGPPNNPSPLRPQMTGPPSTTNAQQPLRPQMTGPQGFPTQPYAGPVQAGRGEPQYAQVPIPAGYGFVRGEGSVAPAPAPYGVSAPVGFAIPPGQSTTPGAPQHMWTQGAIRPVWTAPAPGQPILQPRPVGPQDPNGSTATPSSAEDRQQVTPPKSQDQQSVPPVASGRTPAQSTGAAEQPAVHQQTPISPQPSLASQLVSPSSATVPEGQYAPRPEFSQPARLPSQSQAPAKPMAPPQSQQAASSPHNYTVPRSAFSTIQPPQGPTVIPPNQVHNSEGGLVPERQPSAVSQISVQQGPPSRPSNLSSPAPHPSPAGQSSDATSSRPTPDRGMSPDSVPPSAQDSRTVSPEPVRQPFTSPHRGPQLQMQIQPPQDDGAQSSQQTSEYVKHAPNNSRGSLQVQPQTPRNVPEDNIYDATPRTSTVPPQYRDDGPNRNSIPATEPKSPGPSRETAKAKSPQLNNARLTPPSPIEGDESTNFKDQPTHNRASAVAESTDIANGVDTPPKAHSTDRELFEEAKRRRLLREQEEKIPVFPTEPDPTPPKKDEEDLPQMSATSYPGQEWNPYEAGFGDWED